MIAITVTSTSLYINFQTILMKNEYKNKLEKMENEAEQISKLSNMALNTLYQIYKDISITKLRTYQELDAFDENTAFIQLRYYLSNLPDVDSIYVYNLNNNRIYTVTKEGELVRPWTKDYYEKNSEFYDQSAVELIENNTDYPPYIPIPRYYQVKDTYTKCVYSYMMYDTFSSNKYSNIVMVNYEAQYLFQEKKQVTENAYLVVDQNNKVVYSNTDKYQVLDQLQIGSDLDIIEDDEKSGYFLTTIDGVKSVIIYSGVDKHQWRYISIIEYNMLLSQVRKLQNITILISLFIAFVAVLTAHIYSRRLTVPIRNMTSDIRRLQFENQRAETVAQNRKLNEWLNRGGLDSEGNRKTGYDFLSLIGMQMKQGRYLILLYIYFDGYKSLLENSSIQDIQIYKFSAENILSELLGEKVKTYYLDMGHDKSMIFMNAEEGITKEFIEKNIKQMQMLVIEYFSISLSVICSNIEKNADQLFSMHARMEDAISRRIFWNEGNVAFLDDLKTIPAHDYEYPEQKEKQMLESLMLGKAEDAMQKYESIITQTYQYPIVIYNMVINRLIVAIDHVINHLKKNGSISFQGFDHLFHILEEDDTLDKRNAKFDVLFHQIHLEIEKRKNEKHDQLIARINQLIEEGLENSSFSLDVLADTIGMSTAYLCRIYKQYTGNTIIDVLATKRMEKARELLIVTDLPVNEIAEKVGYNNPTYFYRVFKKTNGITPNDFRKKSD